MKSKKKEILSMRYILCRNVIHGSDSVDNAKKEIALWFPEGVAEWRSNWKCCFL
jgi:hypothetical protein